MTRPVFGYSGILAGNVGVVWCWGCFALILALGVALLCGSAEITFADMFDWLCGRAPSHVQTVLGEIRLPRAIMAANAGAALSLSGLAMQTVLRNPLAEPYILGVSSGAAVGVLGVVLFGGAAWSFRLGALGGGLCALALVCLLGMRRQVTGILLSGVMLNAFCGAIILFLLALAPQADAGTVYFWFMGDLGSAASREVWLTSLLLLPGYVVMLCCGQTMNLLQLGDDTAWSLGVPVRGVCFGLLGLASLMASLIVAMAGPIGFVGLVVPQALRRIWGYDHRRLAPGCLLLGATFMVLCDTCSRSLPTQGDLPAGVMTALIGAPLFIVLLRRVS